jgi:hypothetical protein
LFSDQFWQAVYLKYLFCAQLSCTLQELRKGKYNRTNSSAPDVLHTIVQLGLQVEGTASHTGVTLLPPPTVEALLIDRRRHELVQSFKLAMLKLASQASTHTQQQQQQQKAHSLHLSPRVAADCADAL